MGWAWRIATIAAEFLEHVPLATEDGEIRNLTSIETLDRNIHQFSIRVDHRFGANDKLLARFSTFDADELQPFGTSMQQESLVPGFGRTLDCERAERARDVVRPTIQLLVSRPSDSLNNARLAERERWVP